MRLDHNRLHRVIRSTSFRLAALFAVLLVAAFVVAGVGAWAVTRGVAEQQVREQLLLEMDSIGREVSDEGLQAAVLAIKSRALRPGALAYRLVSPNGAVLAGDLPVQTSVLGWRYLDMHNRTDLRHGQDDLVLLTSRLSDGSVLSIGGDLERGESVRIAVLRALIWVGLLSACVSVIIGLWMTRRTLRRMEALSGTLTRVAEGDLSARTSVRSPSRDDLDQLSTGVNAMLDQVVLLVADVRRVSTDVAHDLRTPLSHLRQDLELAADAPPAEAHHLISSAQGRIDGVLRTFDAMLRLAEIESGSGRARFAAVDLRQLVERVADAYRPDVEAAGGVLTTELTEAVVEGDTDLLAQGLANLIENAMNHGGAHPHISLVVTDGEGGITVSVADDGPGIDRRDHQHVLAPFARLDASRSTPGSGLGLAIVVAVVKLHRAQLALDDAKPGLRVSISWPSHRDALNEAPTR